jgi:hypothetical protein
MLCMYLLGIFTFVLSAPKHPSTSRCIKPLQQIDLLSTSLITLPTEISTSSPLKAIIPHILHWLTRFLAVNTLHHICLILQNDPSTVSTSHTVQHMSKYQKITNCQNPTQKMVRRQPIENSPPVLHHEHQDQPSPVA